ncbi:hypothetical protein Hypma_013129 [Hypsizygus marmoreus]|uniref:Uncharacterized protein n=1 Tax=Hypsizygus marmoreus TaxID=39966 RepID=A0A369JM93_HYPMA|nr:hypothetical protein Hypma_013129 [Hypsizygus marmoreus]
MTSGACKPEHIMMRTSSTPVSLSPEFEWSGLRQGTRCTPGLRLATARGIPSINQPVCVFGSWSRVGVVDVKFTLSFRERRVTPSVTASLTTFIMTTPKKKAPERGKTLQRIRRPGSTREERAMMRILRGHGKSVSDICAHLKCGSGTVYRALQNKYQATPDILTDDYKHVDDAFKRKYPPSTDEDRDPKEVRSMSIVNDDTGADHLPSREQSLAGPSAAGRRSSLRKANGGTSSIGNQPGNKTPASTSVHGHTRRTRRRAEDEGVSRNVPATGDIIPTLVKESSPELKNGIVYHVVSDSEAKSDDSVRELLSTLGHDLLDLYKDLQEQELKTKDDLLLFASWSEDDLHNLFKEAVPEMKVAQRFILVKGLKGYAKKVKKMR